MSALELARSALAGIRAAGTRAWLTLLGVMIGVGSVILLMGVGAGTRAQVTESIAGLGANVITVSPGGSSAALRSQNLTLATAAALEEAAAQDGSAITAVVPVVTSNATVAWRGGSVSGQVVGAGAGYFEVTASEVAQGTGFSDTDMALARRVAVLGADLAEDLFEGADPVGQTVAVGSVPFTVYGVLAEKDSMGSTGVNNGLVIPLTRMQRSLTGYGALSQVVVQAASADEVEAASDAVTVAVADQLGVTTADATFTVTTQAQLLSAGEDVGATLTGMLTAIAAISLVVGGIGVTNIMLVTVSERTREIGIRKALGASRKAIWGQFLVEATLMCLVGGILGVAGAWAASFISIMGVRPVITPSSVALAAGVSIVIGMVFGAYPAVRASSLQPVEALRHE
jgi:putative ABC transport system permease protein